MRFIHTPDDLTHGLEALLALDGRLEAIALSAGPLPLRRQAAGFSSLAEIIVSQMVSKQSASAIWGRLVAHEGEVTPETILSLTGEEARAIGLSGAKIATLIAAAEAVAEGRLDLAGLESSDAQDALARLMAVKGIGRWTGEVYLLFCAGHPDLFPAGDVALRVAVGHAFGLPQRPDEVSVRQAAALWSPWRGVAARLFWAYYARSVRPGAAAPNASADR